MKKIFLLLFLTTSTVGCTELLAYTIGTASQLSGDLIKENFINKKKKEKEMVLEVVTDDKTIVIKEKNNECKDCKIE